jgi:hypothetical protein
MGADISTKCDWRRVSTKRELGDCLVWRDGEPTLGGRGIYGRAYDAELGRFDAAHRVVWRRVYGPIPNGEDGKPLTVDHRCGVTLCQRPDHLEPVTKAENTRRMQARRRRERLRGRRAA